MKDNLIIGLLLTTMVCLIILFAYLWGGVRAVDEFIAEYCTRYEDNTTACLIDGSKD